MTVWFSLLFELYPTQTDSITLFKISRFDMLVSFDVIQVPSKQGFNFLIMKRIRLVKKIQSNMNMVQLQPQNSRENRLV